MGPEAIGAGAQHLIGTYGGGIAATVAGPARRARFRAGSTTLNLGWTYGPWAANLNQTLRAWLHDEPADDVDAAASATYSVWDLNGAYTGFKNWTLTLGVKNLFDRDPPYSRQTKAFQIGYDPALADPTGRFFYGSVKYTFK